jgi:hypothetical protein
MSSGKIVSEETLLPDNGRLDGAVRRSPSVKIPSEEGLSMLESQPLSGGSTGSAPLPKELCRIDVLTGTSRSRCGIPALAI